MVQYSSTNELEELTFKRQAGVQYDCLSRLTTS
jgi:hypothetical protein